MAYIDVSDDFSAKDDRHVGLFRSLVTTLFGHPAVKCDTNVIDMPRKLAGPAPGDRRARGYMADLDMEVGF